MEWIAVIQARMSSTRFPRKMLYPMPGGSLLEHVVGRMNQSQKIHQVIIATSNDKTDDPIVEFCEKNELSCFRGSLLNVYGRFSDLIQYFQLPSFVRISGDSPFIDFRLVDQAIEIFEENPYDLVTNVLTRTYPKGQSVEVIRSSTFLKAEAQILEPFDLEHVTPFFYKNKSSFSIYNFEASKDYSHINMSIDTREDFKNGVSVLEKIQIYPFYHSWIEILKMM